MTEQTGIVELAQRAPLPRMHANADASHRWMIAGYPEVGTPRAHVLYQCGCGEKTSRDRIQLQRALRR